MQTVDWTNGGKKYVEDVHALHAAIEKGNAVTDKPSLIVLDTVIAWPAPNAQGTEAAHGSALGEEEVAATKKVLGFDPERTFEVSDEVLDHTRALLERGSAAGAAWDEQYAAWSQANPEADALLHRLKARALPEGLADALPAFPADAKGVATRSATGKVINALAPIMPELWGGSADLAGSNNTTIEGAPSFLPTSRSTDEWKADPLAGRVLHFGIREHAMGSIMNGVALSGPTRIFGGTFLLFADYMRPAVRLAALMEQPAIYVWTHDSIGLGEDGPTHQPIEHLAALRAIPGLDVVRPADGNETSAAWAAVLGNTDRPAALCLTRQNVPVFPRGEDGYATTENVHRGGYVLLDTEGQPDVVLVGTGSEVQVAVAARELLAEDGVSARVVSMPCREWFDGAGPGLPRLGDPADREGAGVGRGRHRPGVARGRRRPRPDRLDRPLRRLGRLQPHLPGVRHHRRGRRRGGPGQHPGGRLRPSRPPPTRRTRENTTMSTNPLKQLAEAGVSIWLDDLSRERLETGNLADLVKNRNVVVGVTTNPSIFAAALADGERYDAQVRELAADGADVDRRRVFELTTDDVRDACDVLRPVFDATDGVDGRVSIEVSPGLAHDTAGTRQRGRRALGDRRRAQPADQDPRHPGGAGRRSPRRSRPASAST